MKTRALISTAAFRHNLAFARACAPGRRCLAIVKADGYGHGVAGLVDALHELADGAGVARMVEARALRQAGYRGALLLMSGVDDSASLEEASTLELDLVIHHAAHLELCHRVAPAAARPLRFWLKMDSGMHRLGFSPTGFAGALQQLRQLPWCRAVIGMTHFASADEPHNPKTASQLACYQTHTAQCPLDGHSLANSAAILAFPATHADWIRPGLMLYGVNPVPDAAASLLPVMQLEAQVLATRELQAGESVGYNEQWRATRVSRIAYVAAGYADGYPVTIKNHTGAHKAFVAWRGQRVPVVGRVSMDTLAIDCTDIPAASGPGPLVGDWVELWGQTLPVADVAGWAGTIPYHLLTGVSDRVERLYRQ